MTPTRDDSRDALTGAPTWPPDFARRYRDAGYWRGQTFGEMLRGWAEAYGGRVAVVARGTRWSYSELDQRADRLAAGLRAIGIRRYDRVVVQTPNVPEFIVLFFALFRIGAIPIFALPAHRLSEIAYLCNFSRAVAYVIPDVHERFDHRALADAVRSQSPWLEHVIVLGDAGPFVSFETLYRDPIRVTGCEPSDVALFQLSGGTTGLPKLIPRTHDDYAYSIRASAELCKLDVDTTYLAVLPIAHNFPMSSPGVLGTLHAGGKVVLAGNASPEEAFALIERERVTIAAVVPPVALMWLDAAANPRHDLSSLRTLQVGGARLSAAVARRVRPTLGCGLQQVFGMAEGLVNYTRLEDPEDVVVNTQGRPLSPADEIRIVDDDDRDVGPGEVGHLLTRGPYTIRGYYRAEEHNARAFTLDGFYRTGDLVRLDKSNNFVVEGRTKDLINRGGDKISAEELEGHLVAHPAIREVAAVSMPDVLLGERTCVYVVPRDDCLVTLRALRQYLTQRGLATFKLPDRLELIEHLPRTSIGKISKMALRGAIANKIAAPSQYAAVTACAGGDPTASEGRHQPAIDGNDRARHERSRP